MKHRSITLTETQEKAFNVATEAHTKKVHFLWYPQDGGVEFDEFMEDAGKIEIGEWLMQSWGGSVTCNHLPIWKRIGHNTSNNLGQLNWEKVGYYNPDTDKLVLK